MTTRGIGAIGVALLMGGCAQASYDALDALYGGRPAPAAPAGTAYESTVYAPAGAADPIPSFYSDTVTETAVLYPDPVASAPAATYGAPAIYSEPVVAAIPPAPAAPAPLAVAPDPAAGGIEITPYDQLLAEVGGASIESDTLAPAPAPATPSPAASMAPIIEEGETSVAQSAPAPAAPASSGDDGGIDYAALDAALGGAPAPAPAAQAPAQDSYAARTPPASGGGGGGGDLAGTSWRLSSVGGSPVSAEADLHFDRGSGAAGGQGPCNVYGGNYTATAAGALSFEGLTATERACEDLADEEAYFAALEIAARYTISPDGNQLTIADAGGAPLATLAAY